MIGLRRRRRLPGVLVVVSDDGRSLRREVPAAWVEDFAAAAAAEGGEAARLLWERHRRLDGEALLAAWPPSLERPERATFAAAVPRSGLGPVLEVGLRAGANLRQHADELERVLGGAPLPPALEPEPEPEDAPAGPETASRKLAPGSVSPAPQVPEEGGLGGEIPPGPAQEEIPTQPSGAPGVAHELTHFPGPVSAGAAGDEPPPRPAPEVLAPGEHLARRGAGRRWRPGPDDVFGLFGALHPEDLVDDGLDVREEDVPWLNPGDRIHSPRRGSCRILSVDEGRRVLRVRDENGLELRIPFRELFTEFEFDDEPPEDELP